MARTFVAFGLFLATSIGFAGPAPAQYNPQSQYYNPQPQYNPQYNPPSQYNNPGTYQGYQSNQGNYPGGQQGPYQGNQRNYPGGPQGDYQGNQPGCPYGQQFDPRQNRCVTAAAAMPSCPKGQQYDPGQNRCIYSLPGGVTVPGSLLGRGRVSSPHRFAFTGTHREHTYRHPLPQLWLSEAWPCQPLRSRCRILLPPVFPTLNPRTSIGCA